MDAVQFEEAAPTEEEVRHGKIDQIQSALVKRRDAWLSWRISQGYDKRWQEDLDAYYGRGDTSEDRSPKWFEKRAPISETKVQRSRVKVNITQAKTDAGVARVQEILFPTDDRNFGVSQTPVPELAVMADDTRPIVNAPPGPDGQQPTVKQVAMDHSAEARRRAKLMEDEIADQLAECDYNQSCRDAVEWGGILGTGVIKGPVVIKRTSRSATMAINGETGKPMIHIASVESRKPVSESIDPRNFVPDPRCGGDIRKASGVFERRSVSRSGLRELVGRPGYDEFRIRQVLSQRPKREQNDPIPEENIELLGAGGENYVLWEFHGELDEAEIALITGEQKEESNPLAAIRAAIIFVNDVIIGAYEYIVESDGFIYDIFNWKKDKSSVFGFGIPYLYRTQQRVIDASWRATMDNMGASSGAHVIMKKGKVWPADNVASISGRKLWYAADDVPDVRQVWDIRDIPSKLQDLIALIQVARELGDEELNIPQLLQGFKGSAPDQVGSMLALLAKAEGVLRKVVKQFDDDVTRRHIRRYYHFNMQWNPKPEIKGDMQIDPRGADVLFTRDMRSQLMLLLANMMESPRFGPWLKERDILLEIARAGYMPSVIKTQEEHDADLQSQPPAPPDPRIVTAELGYRAKQEELADRKEQRELDAAEFASNREIKSAEVAYNQQREQGEYAIAMTDAQNERDIAFAKLANERNMSVEQLMAQWKIKTLEIDSSHQLFNAEAKLRRETGEGI